ncbi:hypothetical protein [Ancylomarina longa]|uniref:Uncharacterized protein n=1 Tax=Ancylomarina longa TaxID=2487017 RepID=A0A434AWW3_9BACT|nr:hypothetical protein [Ancylomarina longa]RUT78916.1 hypothetical protein DLK05_05380 [Ancylomarina longa]
MNYIEEISKYLLPSLVVFATAYLVMREFLRREEKKAKLEVLLHTNKETIPIRLQAYERLILFLERIHPESIIIRENEAGLNNKQLQQKLLTAIRTEFEHNLSQQIYVSPKLWMHIKNAKESIIQLVNAEAMQLLATDSSLSLSKAVIESHMQQQNSVLEIAKTELKEEISLIWK